MNKIIELVGQAVKDLTEWLAVIIIIAWRPVLASYSLGCIWYWLTTWEWYYAEVAILGLGLACINPIRLTENYLAYQENKGGQQ